MAAEGIIFNIQRFCTHDGPGIRTTVFLKGCPLGCLWCSNPESQALKPQLMTRDVKCVRCGSCAKACHLGAISFSDEGGRRIDWERCNHCFECVGACLYGALTAIGESKTVESVATIIEKDRVFYKNSGGGATISGGEPLLQHNFLLSLLRSLKENGIHVVLDTTGHAPTEVVDNILPLTDLVLYDIKHLDPRTHKELTGVDNRLTAASLIILISRFAGTISLSLLSSLFCLIPTCPALRRFRRKSIFILRRPLILRITRSRDRNRLIQNRLPPAKPSSSTRMPLLVIPAHAALHLQNINLWPLRSRSG